MGKTIFVGDKSTKNLIFENKGLYFLVSTKSDRILTKKPQMHAREDWKSKNNVSLLLVLQILA
ncbi:MAG: hypothetical protein ACTSWX_16450 [Promethearchaeota archaeon]